MWFLGLHNSRFPGANIIAFAIVVFKILAGGNGYYTSKKPTLRTPLTRDLSPRLSYALDILLHLARPELLVTDECPGHLVVRAIRVPFPESRENLGVAAG